MLSERLLAAFIGISNSQNSTQIVSEMALSQAWAFLDMDELVTVVESRGGASFAPNLAIG
jgi:hypothetical protein